MNGLSQTVTAVDPPEKPRPRPGPEIPPPDRPTPGTPRPVDPPERPAPGDPTPTKPKPDPPSPLRPEVLAAMLLFFWTGNTLAQPANRQIDDDDILAAVELELRYDDVVSADMVDVQVDEGVVMLSGRAFTLLAKRRAVLLVGSLKGVRVIVDRVEVFPSGRTDEEILADVQAVLRDDPVAERKEIRVKVDGGRVTLEGEVDSLPEQGLTARAVSHVRGVLEIDNQLNVNQSAERPDDEIKPEIMRRFAISPFLYRRRIDVELNDGFVRLRGEVCSVNEKDIATLLAWIAGVREVDTSELEIRAHLNQEAKRDYLLVLRNDIDLQHAVEDALLYDPRVRVSEIDVRVQQGAVTLLGNVSRLNVKRAAQQDAQGTLGVRRVVNYLKVKQKDWLGDLAITERAQKALARDAHLTGSDVRASSHFGKVYLTGEVNSYFEKERAEEVLANIPGALDVVNRLNVDATWKPKPDEEIQEDVHRRLRWSPLLADQQIVVLVVGGVVTLHGTVDTWHERTTAEEHAFQAGARSVNNRLDVRSRRSTPLGLKAILKPNEANYVLDPQHSEKEFRRLLELAKLSLDPSRLPSPPEVDLVLKLHNGGKRPIDLRVGHDKCEVDMSLIGEGAVHVPDGRSFTAEFRSGRLVTIPPGENFEIPITSLQFGFRGAAERWYWTEPGKYLLQTTFIWPADEAGMFMKAIAATPIELTVTHKGEDDVKEFH